MRKEDEYVLPINLKSIKIFVIYDSSYNHVGIIFNKLIIIT